MKWEDPPDPVSKYAANAYETEAAELKAHPKRWGVIDSFAYIIGQRNNEARRIANQINAGKYVAFRPAGSFEAKSRKMKNEHGREVVTCYARYVGGSESVSSGS